MFVMLTPDLPRYVKQKTVSNHLSLHNDTDKQTISEISAKNPRKETETTCSFLTSGSDQTLPFLLFLLLFSE